MIKELDAGTPTDSARSSTPNLANGTIPHKPITETIGRNINFQNTRSWQQHVVGQTKHVSNGQLKSGKSRVRNRASVPLNKNTKWKQFEHCSAIQPGVQQYSSKQSLSSEQEF